MPLICQHVFDGNFSYQNAFRFLFIHLRKKDFVIWENFRMFKGVIYASSPYFEKLAILIDFSFVED